MRWRVRPRPLEGSIVVPGDKSIAHRAVIMGALSRGRTHIQNLPMSAAVLATVDCFRALGAGVDLIDGAAELDSDGLHESESDLYAGNSATTMRLLTGVLAGQPFSSRITGDRWLSRRPMGRIVEPLSLMGAEIHSSAGMAPLEIRGRPLRGVRYTLPVASAQVKSALLLAGLFAGGETTVVEPIRTRDHTERLFRAVNIEVRRQNGTVSIRGGQRPRPFSIDLPGDISSAAFFFAGAALTDGAVTIRGLGVNPTRAAFLDVLERMGARVEVRNRRMEMEEPTADVTVSGRIHDAVEIAEADVPLLVDELPLVALLATQANGRSEIRGASELRVKESDRISGVAGMLAALGADLDERSDGFLIRGPVRLRGAVVSSQADHRLAMLAAVAGALAQGETIVESAEATAVSFPEFRPLLAKLGGIVDEA